MGDENAFRNILIRAGRGGIIVWWTSTRQDTLRQQQRYVLPNLLSSSSVAIFSTTGRPWGHT